MPKSRTFGISGTAMILGMGGLYLVYVGLKDVPFFDGLRSLLRKEQPTPRPREPSQILGFAGATGATGPAPGDVGIDGLVGYAAMHYPRFRQFGLQILGRGLRPTNPNSDHPLGKALDVMRPSSGQAAQIISLFMSLQGAKYWIWNRQIANKEVGNWAKRPYSGVSPHTDHVHLSFY